MDGGDGGTGCCAGNACTSSRNKKQSLGGKFADPVMLRGLRYQPAHLRQMPLVMSRQQAQAVGCAHPSDKRMAHSQVVQVFLAMAIHKVEQLAADGGEPPQGF